MRVDTEATRRAFKRRATRFGAAQEPVADCRGDQSKKRKIHDLRRRHYPARLILLMRRFTKDTKRKTLLILGKLSGQWAMPSRAWLDANASRIDVFYLPPVDPELT